jgi:uncharacterized membrane protein YfcA
MPLNIVQIAAAWVVLVGAALVQGSVGFGMALIASPLVALIDPLLVPGPIISVGLVLSGLIAFRERQAIDFSGLTWALPGLLGGVLAGALVVSVTPPARIGIVLGTLVLIAVGMSIAGLHVSPTPQHIFWASLLAGFMSTTSSIPGPPLALLYQRATGARLRGTLAPLFLVCGVFSLSALTSVGRCGWGELRTGLSLAPGVVLGFSLSTSAARWLDRATLRPAVLAVSAAAAVGAIIRGVF